MGQGEWRRRRSIDQFLSEESNTSVLSECTAAVSSAFLPSPSRTAGSVSYFSKMCRTISVLLENLITGKWWKSEEQHSLNSPWNCCYFGKGELLWWLNSDRWRSTFSAFRQLQIQSTLVVWYFLHLREKRIKAASDISPLFPGLTSAWGTRKSFGWFSFNVSDGTVRAAKDLQTRLFQEGMCISNLACLSERYSLITPSSISFTRLTISWRNPYVFFWA